MGYKQYIGARYVPLFYENSNGTAQWESGVAYEPLTIVEYNGNSYTSKRAVPSTIGSPNLNNEYWAQTGITSTQINSLTNRVDNLENEYSELVDDQIIIITDSYGVTGGGITAFTDLVETEMLKRYSKYAYSAVGGSGFATVSGQESFTDQLSHIVDGTDIDDNRVSRILVVGGTNDAKFGSTTAMASGVLGFLSTVAARFENIKRVDYIYCPHVAGNTYNYPNTYGTYYYLKQIASANSPVMPFYVKNGIGIIWWGDLGTDGVHPKQEGQKALAEAVIDFLDTGNVNIDQRPYNLTGTNTIGTVMMYMGEENFRLHFTLAGSVTSGASASLTGKFALSETLFAGGLACADPSNGAHTGQLFLTKEGGLTVTSYVPGVSNGLTMTYVKYEDVYIPNAYFMTMASA